MMSAELITLPSAKTRSMKLLAFPLLAAVHVFFLIVCKWNPAPTVAEQN